MKLASQLEFSAEQESTLKKACIIEYISVFYIASVVTLMYMVMGTSQAMKAAWIEDCLSLIPPICFLVGSYIFRRKPTQHFPYGFHRAVSILYLCAALALFLMGAYLLIDAVIKLVSVERSSIGMKIFFGHDM